MTKCERLEFRCLLAAGDVDPSFGTNGRTLVDIGDSADDFATAILRLGDGGFLLSHSSDGVTGDYTTGFSKHFADGMLDPSFGTNGSFRLTSFLGWGRGARRMILDPSGNLLAFSSSNTGPNSVRAFTQAGVELPSSSFTYATTGVTGDSIDIAASGSKFFRLSSSNIYRLNFNGSKDTSYYYGTGVFTFPSQNGMPFRANSFIVNAQGGLFVSGFLEGDSAKKYAAVAKVHPNGGLDVYFGSSGIASLGTSNNSQAVSVCVDASGRLLISGNNGYAGFVTRLTDSGDVDSSYGVAGIRNLPLVGGISVQAGEMQIDSAGRAILPVNTNASWGKSYYLVRLTSSGAMDTAFSGDGIQSKPVPTSAGTLEHGGPIIIDSADNIIGSVGAFTETTLSDTTWYRLRASDGSPDPTFANTRVGFIGRLENRATTSCRKPDGKLVIVGYPSDGDEKWEVLQLNPDGTPDTSFDGDGQRLVDWGTLEQYPYDVKVDSEGRIIIAGYVRVAQTEPADAVVARLLPNGSLDPAFASGGMLRINTPTISEWATALTILSDDRIVVGSTTAATGTVPAQFQLHRLTTAGAIDSTFGTAGRVIFGTDPYRIGDLFTLDEDRILVIYYLGSGMISFAMRLNANGTVDTTYGINGVAGSGSSSQNFYHANAVVDREGRLYLPATRDTAFVGETVSITRWTSWGTVDTSYGVDGIAKYILPTRDHLFSAMGMDASGRLLLGAGGPDAVIARLRADGSIDDGFGTGGTKLFDFAGDLDYLNGIFSAGNDKIALLGYERDTHYAIDFAAAQLLNPPSDGVPPTLLSGVYQLDSAVPEVWLTFSESLGSSLATTDVLLDNLSTGIRADVSSLSIAPYAGNTARISFNSAVPRPEDGNYRLRIRAGSVTDDSGTPTNQDLVAEFFVLAADANRDRRVDTVDFNLLAANFGASTAAFSQGDFDYTGWIDSVDFDVFLSRYGRSLLAPTAMRASSLFADIEELRGTIVGGLEPDITETTAGSSLNALDRSILGP